MDIQAWQKHILTRWMLDESQPSWCTWMLNHVIFKDGKKLDWSFLFMFYVCASPASTESWWCHYVGILSLPLSVWMADRFDYWRTSVRPKIGPTRDEMHDVIPPSRVGGKAWTWRLWQDPDIIYNNFANIRRNFSKWIWDLLWWANFGTQFKLQKAFVVSD